MQELFEASHNPSGVTGIVKINDEHYAANKLYWAVREKETLTVYDDVKLHLSNSEFVMEQKNNISRIKSAMTCPLDELPLLLNDTLVSPIVRKRLKEGF